MVAVTGTGQGRFHEAPSPKTEGSAVSLELVGVDRQNVDQMNGVDGGQVMALEHGLGNGRAPRDGHDGCEEHESRGSAEQQTW